MNIQGVKKYCNELGVLVSRVEDISNGLESLTALIRAADGAGDRQQQLALTQQREAGERQLGALSKALADVARRPDRDTAHTLLIDLTERVGLAEQEFVTWRRVLAEFEFQVAEGGFAPEPTEGEQPAGYTRAMAEQQLERQKARVERRVALAVQLVPERPVVLL